MINLTPGKLQPFRITGGWNIMWNHFRDVDVETLDPNKEDDWLFLVQDITYIVRNDEHKVNHICVDLGWYPEADPNGKFILYVIQNQDWEKPLEEFSSRNVRDIAEKMGDFLQKYVTQ